MTPVTKYALIGGAAAVGLYLLWPKQAVATTVVAPPPPPPTGGTTTTTTTTTPPMGTGTGTPSGTVAMDVTGPVAADAVIDPVSKTLTAPTVTALDNWFEHYYVTSVLDSTPTTKVLAATLIPSGQVPQDPNNVLSTAALNISKLGWNVLVTKDVGDAGLLNDPSKLPSSMVLSATKDPASMQATFHKGGYLFRPASA